MNINFKRKRKCRTNANDLSPAKGQAAQSNVIYLSKNIITTLQEISKEKSTRVDIRNNARRMRSCWPPSVWALNLLQGLRSTAGVKLAWDRDNDIVYVTAAYKQKEQTPVIHAASRKALGQ